MQKIFTLFAIHLFLFSSLLAQEDKTIRLSGFIEKTMKAAPVIPGVSVAVANSEGTLFARGFGFADIENEIPATAETDFYIASITKAFNGLLATILEEEGKIDLSQKITHYKPFSQFKNKSVFENISVMDLLSHQSGMDNKFLSFKLAYTGDFSEEEILRLIEENSKSNEEGKTFQYTNFGYYLLDVLIKAETGKSWKDLLREKLFSPLGMDNTTAYISKVPAKNLALPYLTIFPDQVERSYLMKNDQTMHAAGGLVTSAEDIGKFLSFYLNEGQLGERQIFPREIITKTFVKQAAAEHKRIDIFDAFGYGTGWRLGKFESHEVVYHFGGYSGFFSHLSFLPNQQLGVAVFVNHELGMPLADLIAEYAYHLYLGHDSELQKMDNSAATDLGKLLKRYQKAAQANEKKMAKRTWQLTLPKLNYTGTFNNEKIGTMEVYLQEGELHLKTGRLKATCTPFPEQDCARIELVPGSGRVIQFIPENGKLEKFKFNGEIFERI